MCTRNDMNHRRPGQAYTIVSIYMKACISTTPAAYFFPCIFFWIWLNSLVIPSQGLSQVRSQWESNSALFLGRIHRKPPSSRRMASSQKTSEKVSFSTASFYLVPSQQMGHWLVWGEILRTDYLFENTMHNVFASGMISNWCVFFKGIVICSRNRWTPST